MDDTKIPAELRRVPQWIGWKTEYRSGEATKVPLDPATGAYASVTAPETWAVFETALEYYRATDGVEGVGFVFTAEDPYAGVDLDTCRAPDTGEVEDWAVDVLRRLESYTEVSPSGTGFHVIVEAEIPSGGNRAEQLEMYDRGRYFTVTGDRVPGAPTGVGERADELVAIHEAYIATPEQPSAYVPVETRPDVALSDAELLEKARNAANGDKFQRLYDHGDVSGYDSHSEADQALCNLLAFWTGGDAQRIEALFAQSDLVRDKWRNRPDYRERTIKSAIRGVSAFYNPADQ